MIERLVSWSHSHHRLVVSLVLVSAAAAGFLATKLRFDALPDVTGKQVSVITRAPGRTPEEVERLVTQPIELALSGVPGLAGQRSISRYGISSVTVVFEEHVDLMQARQLVHERAQAVAGQLPPNIDSPELGPLTGGLGEIYQFTLTSSTRSPSELLTLTKFRVAPLLASVPGVVEVNSWGGERRTLDVVADPAQMARNGVTLAQLTEAVRTASGQVPGASLEAGDAGVLLRGISWPRTPSELAATVIKVLPSGSTVQVGDIGEVKEGAEPRIGAATVDGRGEGVYVMVQMLLEANALEVLENVKARMEEVHAALPEDVEIRVVYDRGELVHATLATVFKNLLEGGILVVVVLFLMLGSFRAGALVASIIPLSMLGAAAGMVLFDIPGNLMSLGALDFGLLVDGGVVMVEAVFQAVHRRGGSLAEHAAKETRGIARPVFFSVMIILLVYVPILTLSGVEGSMFKPMALTVVLALSTALLLSLTYVPAAVRLLLRTQDVPRKDPIVIRVATHFYKPVLRMALARPKVVASLALCFLAGGATLFYRAGSSFIPTLDEGDLVVQTTRRPDIRIETAVAAALRMEAAIRKAVPEVENVSTRTGSPAVATDLMGLEQADVFIDLAPKDRWRSGIGREKILADIERAVMASSSPEEIAFTQPIQMRFNELVGGDVTDVSLSLYGDDLEQLQALAYEAQAAVEGVPGAEDARVLAPPPVRLIEVRPRPLEASQQGLRSEDILNHVQALKTGVEVGRSYDGPLSIPIRIKFGPGIDAFTLGAMAIPTPSGGMVQLSRVAEVSDTRGPSLINHNLGARRVVLGFNVRGRDLGTVVEEAKKALSSRVPVPAGVRTAWGGQFENLERTRKRMMVVIPGVLLLITAFLAFLFRSLRPTFLILLNIPFAAVGGIVALTARGLPLSVSAAVGFIALSGIAVLNGVVLVSALMDLLSQGQTMGEACYNAAVSRMRPVLMTATVAALGFVPMMLAQGTGAEVQRPLATVVVGGLVSSTLLTLVILPAMGSAVRGKKTRADRRL